MIGSKREQSFDCVINNNNTTCTCSYSEGIILKLERYLFSFFPDVKKKQCLLSMFITYVCVIKDCYQEFHLQC